MKRIPFIVPLLLAVLAAAVCAQHSPDPIRPEMLRPHLRFLSSDEMQGRETAQPGQRIAALYIASVFERLGLEAAGDSGSYVQRFRLYQVKTGRRHFAMSDPAGERLFSGASQDHYFMIDGSDTVAAGLVFCGYGIDDKKEFGYSDYEGVDVRKKAVLVLAGSPGHKKGPSKWDNSFGTPSLSKIRAARTAGAAALLVVNESDAPPIEVQIKAAERLSARTTLSLRPPSWVSLDRIPVIVISEHLADTLLRVSGTTVAELRRSMVEEFRPRSFIVDQVSVAIASQRTIDTVWTENVIAKLPGADPARRDEAVVFSAHFDHIGTRWDGEVYNGADDDASGTAAVLALAEAFSKAKTRPRRSLLFLAVTGEEKGLLGSSWYTEHPAVPMAKTACNLNIDMIGRSDPKHDSLGDRRYTYVIGSSRISKELDDILQAQNRRKMHLSLDYTYDSPDDPNQFYRRSDHYNFAKHGVPVIFFFTGEHADYHRVTDDFEKIDFTKMAGIGSLIYHVGFEVANRKAGLKKIETKN